MSVDGPYFHAWCADADRVDAFAEALLALGQPKTWEDDVSVEDAVSSARARFTASTAIYTCVCPRLCSGRVVLFDIQARRDAHPRGCMQAPLYLTPDDRWKFFISCGEIVPGGDRSCSVQVEAAISAIQTQDDTEDLLLRLCAPDGSRRVVTGGCSDLGEWGPPIEMAATYHVDPASVARDLALSWVRIHDGYQVERAAGMAPEVLRARIEAAPHGNRIAVARDIARARKHCAEERHAELERIQRLSHDIDMSAYGKKLVALMDREDALLLRGELPSRGTRVALPGDAELTREQVLAALATPPATLLEALEASAVPDDEWRAVEPLALELIQAAKEGAPTEEVKVDSGKHTRFIEHHAPYHVRRLPNGGVILATHPYRTLWPLWSDALYLLGITP